MSAFDTLHSLEHDNLFRIGNGFGFHSAKSLYLANDLTFAGMAHFYIFRETISVCQKQFSRQKIVIIVFSLPTHDRKMTRL